MIDIRQTRQYSNYLNSLGWKVKRIKSINYAVKKLFILGSIIKIQRPKKLDLNTVQEISKDFRCFQTIIEPVDDKQVSLLKSCGYKLSNNPFVPSKTIYINLLKTKKELLSDMHHKTRYNIGVAIRNKLQTKVSKDIQGFSDFWQSCALKQRGMFLSQKKEINEIYKAFGKNSDIIFVYKKKELLAGILLIHTKEKSYYMYAAATSRGKKLFGPTLAAWEAILISKKKGPKIFDFEGIYDERFPLKSWLGFSRFKKSFGGKEIEYPGAYTKFRFPV